MNVFSHLLVNPKERRVVIVESVFTVTQFRETLVKVLFEHYEVSLWSITKGIVSPAFLCSNLII